MLATIRGDGPGAALFTRASALVRSLQIRSDTDLEPLLQSPPADADEGVLRQLRYMAEAGSWVLRESAIADLPADLRWLYESGAVTIEQLATLHSTLGVTSAADLLAELRRMNIQRLPGFHPGLEASIAAALPGLRLAIPRISLARAVAIADPILDCLVQTPGVDSPTPVGSFRRGEDMVGDIEIVAPTADPAAALDAVAGVAENARVLHRSPRRLYIRTDRVQVGVRCPSPDTAGATLLHLTGNGGHIEALRRMAADRGWSLDPEGLRSAEDRTPVADSEEAIYDALGLPWIPPEIRNGDEEIAAAKSGTLPPLVSWRDIRGDLHMHTEWSDGRNTTEEMVRGCIALGYEYMAITDHSPHASSSRNLSVEGVKRQSEEIAALRRKVPADHDPPWVRSRHSSKRPAGLQRSSPRKP